MKVIQKKKLKCFTGRRGIHGSNTITDCSGYGIIMVFKIAVG
jgi:hypothetical protein